MAAIRIALNTTFMDLFFLILFFVNFDFLIFDYKFRKRIIIVLFLRKKNREKMINRFFIDKIGANFAYTFTEDQRKAIEKIVDFLFSKDDDRIFVLKGYAGTGKSSLIGSLVKTMNDFDQKTVLLAPTGRAAKVFAGYAGQQASTIHKKIYRQQKVTDAGSRFKLSENLHKHTLFIVDEASMISNESGEVSNFGSGRLLDDLVDYVYSGVGCRLLFLGDTAQLPPVMQENSPALDVPTLQSYGLSVTECMLPEIVRQENPMLIVATELKKLL
jgi:exodeoxyribonuclease-5